MSEEQDWTSVAILRPWLNGLREQAKQNNRNAAQELLVILKKEGIRPIKESLEVTA